MILVCNTLSKSPVLVTSDQIPVWLLSMFLSSFEGLLSKHSDIYNYVVFITQAYNPINSCVETAYQLYGIMHWNIWEILLLLLIPLRCQSVHNTQNGDFWEPIGKFMCIRHTEYVFWYTSTERQCWKSVKQSLEWFTIFTESLFSFSCLPDYNND